MSNIDNSFGFDAEATIDQGEAPGSRVGVVRVLKRDYAVGLHWNGVEQPTKAATEARELASSSSFQADFFCVRHGGTPQFGLGFKAQGHKSGMPSLAAHVALAKGGSWIGLFEVPGGYYLVAVRDDGILSECDRHFDDAEAARNVFEDFQSQSDWNEAIAPADFEIPGTVSVTIESLIEGRPQVRLQEVSRSSNLIKLGIGVLAVGGLILGVMFYLDHVEENRQWELAQELARTAQNVISPQEEQVVIPPMPWELKPMGAYMIQECYKQVRKFPLDIPGWEVSEFFCEGESVAAAIDRVGALGSGGGSINWIKLQVENEGFKPSIIPPAEGSGGRVSVQWGLEGIPKIPVDLETAPLSKMKAAMLAVMEERMTPVIFSEADSNEFWRGFSFSFTTAENPLGFTDVIGALPGVMMNSVKFDVKSNKWTLEGIAYEQLPLPQQPVN